MEQLVSPPMKPGPSLPINAGPCLKAARRLVIMAVLLPALFLSLILLDGFYRAAGQDQSAIHWMRVLDLGVPAFSPSGTPQRHPSALPEGFDLRLAPLAGGADRFHMRLKEEGGSK
jgi:hypothetical protein